MLLNSIEFLFFLPIVFLVYWGIGYARINDALKLRLQNVALLLASYAFYAWWDWRFLGLLVGMSLISWCCGYLINCSQYTSHFINAKCLMITNVVLDLGVLALFKYYNFFIGSFADLFGLQNSIHSMKIVLPLGISFFTFQAIAYVVDVYKRKIEPTNLVDCLLYIGFFPKLLAGPIERPTNLIPQIQKSRVFEYDLAVDGCRQMLWGLFKKIVVADNCAIYVDQVWSTYDTQSGSNLLLAAILYSIQIYGDFSGYSDMAIGTAKLLGFRFRDNFLFPYFSRNMNEFWRRWHISLNTWFVDYLYIPLGGSRDGKWHTIRNIMIVFLLSGLWHGADWSFVAWGAYHGLLLVLLILLNQNTKYEHVVAYDRLYPNLKEFGQMLLVFALATFGWMMFRADNMSQFIDYTARMCSADMLSIPCLINRDYYLPVALWITILFVVEWMMRNKKHGMDMATLPAYVRYMIYLMMVFIIGVFGGQTTNYIYFQF